MWLEPLSRWFVAVAMLGQTATAAPPAAPQVIATKESVFQIPFRVERIDNPMRQPTELQLLVSTDRGARWQMHAKAQPVQRHFLFRASGDGEYWFAIRVVDRAGQIRPETIAGPALRVLVDTKPPALKLAARRGPMGQVTVHWEADQPDIKPNSLSIQYRETKDSPWQPVAIDRENAAKSGTPQSGEVAFGTKSGAKQIEIRAEVSDRVGNPAVAQTAVTLAQDRGPEMTTESKGSVAIAINPAIGAKYPALEGPTNSEATAALPPGERPRMVSSRLFQLEYDVDAIGPSGIGRVELWGTRDGGRTWRSFTVDQDNRSPLLVNVDEEGLYGFRLGVANGAGLGGHPPQGGDVPDLWVGVDVTKPLARITSAEQGVESEARYLIISWQADDKTLAARPVSLTFSPSRTGPWLPIAAGLENSGRYAWPLDSRTPPQFFLRLEVRDEAGNVGVHQTSEPITIDQSRPTIRVRDIRPVERN